MDMPSCRWRVVERGRRLVMIDRAGTDGRVVRPPRTRPRAHGPVALLLPVDVLGATLVRWLAMGASTHAGEIIHTTGPMLDEKGPREIVLDDRAARRLGRLFVGAIGIAVAGAAVTTWQPELAVAAIVLLVLAQSWVTTLIRRRATALYDSLIDPAAERPAP